MDDEVIHITRDDTEVVDNSGYRELTDHFAPIPEVAKPLLKEAKATLLKRRIVKSSATPGDKRLPQEFSIPGICEVEYLACV